MPIHSRPLKPVLLILIPAFLTFPAPVISAQYEWGCVDGWDGNGNPTRQCGYGYWRTLCGWNAGVEECETFFEIVGDAVMPGISNVLFLHGIKGSRLYRPTPDCSGPPAACAVKLWEPYGNSLAQQLFLNNDGRSLHNDVFVQAGDVLADALGQEFYTSFFNDLHDAEVSDAFGKDWRWEAGAYDWRLSLPDLVTRGELEDTRINYSQTSDVPYLEEQLRDLAEDSPTGKVSIITHSNGGLVAKALLAKLDGEAAELVDKIIFVGVPHLGAPQALGALLYGHGEALPFDECAAWRATSWACGLLMNRTTARMFAQHAPMAYHLLPSKAYFDKESISDYPVTRFSADTLYRLEREQYGETIDSEEELHAFAIARDGGRTAPSADDLGNASVLPEKFLTYARDTHALDTWQPPLGIEAYYIIGWGKETISGIEFYEEPDILGLFGKAIPRYRPLFMHEGDGVVPAVSAGPLEAPDVYPTAARTANTENTYWIDLASINEKRLGSDRGHGTLFEVDAIRQLLIKITNGTLSPDALPVHASTSVPEQTEAKSWLRIFLHSPLTLELYEGTEHLGFNEDGTFDTQIEGATYDEFGEVKYIIAPADRDYKLRFRAEGIGSFSLDIQKEIGQETTTTSVLQVPVNIGDVAHMALPKETAAILELEIDRTGDGTTDEKIVSTIGTSTPYAIHSPPADRPNSSSHSMRHKKIVMEPQLETRTRIQEMPAAVPYDPVKIITSSTTTDIDVPNITTSTATNSPPVVMPDAPQNFENAESPRNTLMDRYASISIAGVLLLFFLSYLALRRTRT